MAKKATTASVEIENLALAKTALKAKQKTGMIDEDEIVLSVADHGDWIMVYVSTGSFGVRKVKEDASTSAAG
jgi:hypothetical protein